MDCTVEEGDAEARVTYSRSGSYFRVTGDSGHYMTSYVVGDGPMFGPLENLTWLRVPERVARWAADVKRDADTPDLWAELLAAQGSNLTPSVPGRGDNSPFTGPEQEQLRTAIEQIRAYGLAATELAEDHRSEVEAKLDYLIAASKRTGRIDWKNIAMTVLVTTAVEVGRDPAQRAAFLDFCATALADLVMHLPQLPIR